MDDPRIVFDSPDRRACADRALVLEAVRIPWEIVDEPGAHALIVPAAHSPQAAEELRLYDEENRPRPPPRVAREEFDGAGTAVFVYVAVVFAVAWAAGQALFGVDWLSAGRVDGALIRDGEWWRTITALTLHAGPRHLLGNILFGAFFGYFAGRLLGPGAGWAAVLAGGAAGNALNTLLLESAHRAIGASTAVFAALGLLAGFVWRARLMAQERWPYRVGPIVGGFALLMFTGTGDENTDIGAHLMGFLCGLAEGVLLAGLRPWLRVTKVQVAAAAGAVIALAGAWYVALHAGFVASLL